ncbi:MAG: oligopeptidase A, partial [Gammaproteobacteria bacterium]|nr:oligopeptidase A [Gammaproteobacteria bacterium]
MSNPLLEQTGLPTFSRIMPEHIEPAIDHLLAENRHRIGELLDTAQSPDWDSVVEPIEEWEDRLGRIWSPVSHMNSVVNSEALRAAYNACLPKLSDYGTEMGQNEKLFAAYQAVAANPGALDAGQRRVLDNALRDFHLSGVDLPADKKLRFKQISQELSSLTSRYSENVLDATDAWSKRVDDAAALSGLPQSAIDLARQSAEQRGQTGWLLTLDYPSFHPVL